MKYWVYINDKVVGPYEQDALASLEGFTPDTLICKDGSQNWVKASSLFDFDISTVPNNQPAQATAAPAAQENTAATTAAAAQPATTTQSAATLATTATAAAATTTAATLDASAAQILIDKIDRLTKEIEGMKTKLEQTWQATAATQAAMEKIQAAPVVSAGPAIHEEPLGAALTPDEDKTLMEGLDTKNLVNHAEEIVAQAGTDKAEKPLDFLNEIQIGDASNGPAAAKGGEEIVLRSALDSMSDIHAEPTASQEKENTVQDLLSPAKTAAVAGIAAAGAAAVTAAAMSHSEPQQQPQPQQPTVPAQPVAAPTTPEAIPQPVPTEKREEIINEITGAAPMQAPEMAATTPAAPVEQNSGIVKPYEVQEPSVVDMSSLNTAVLPKDPEKQTIDLGGEEPPQSPVTAPAQPAQQPAELLKTAQELVPGQQQEEEKSEDDLISQADLDEAFTEREPVSSDFPLPAESQPAATDQPAAANPPAAEQAAPVYNPKDMTEIALSEGSTYLISDFIPPASNPDGSANAAAALAATAAATSAPQTEMAPTQSKVVEENQELIPDAAPNDMTMSKVILENTIHTKRGASMDIKTVPMVKEPADSSRLDLKDSDLDLNAQHDVKAADFKQPNSGATKVIVGAILAVGFVAFLYVALAYLGIIPAQFNLLKKPAKAQTALSDSQTNEMLGIEETVSVPAANAEQPLPAPETAAQPALPAAAADMAAQPFEAAAANPTDAILNEVKNFPMVNGQTLEQLINSRHPAAQGLIEWTIATAVEPDNYSVLVKVPPENPQSFRMSYRFNYNTITKTLDPTISDSKNLLDSLKS